MARRRGFARPSPLISLLDVLFILVFASLAQATARMERPAAEPEPVEEVDALGDAGPLDAGVLDAGPGDAAPDADASLVPAVPARLRARAYEAVLAEARQRATVFARITADGALAWVERADGEVLPVGVPLLERIDDPDVVLIYRGAADPARRVCSLVRAALDAGSLEEYLVIMVAELPVKHMRVALARGLHDESRWCRRDHGGLAVLVEAEIAEVEEVEEVDDER